MTNPHLTTDELILFMDREMNRPATLAAEKHLLACEECSQALKKLSLGSEAYTRYRKHVLEPAFPVPVSGWKPIGGRLAAERSKERRQSHSAILWAAIAASLCIAAFSWWYFQPPSQPSAQQILNRAESVPDLDRANLVFTSGQRRFVRPAVLEAGYSEARFQHVRALFVEAHYSWANPLSARSFADWRRQLPQKRDFVTAIHEENGQSFYRIRTRTDDGVLRSASLVLETATYHPTRASFEFEGEQLLQVSKQTDAEQSIPQQTSLPTPAKSKTVETAAGPEDELRVLAALDAMGASADEPIGVKLDPSRHAVVVTGMGLAPDREKQVQAALAILPNTVVHFNSEAPLARDAKPLASENDSAANGLLFHQKLQDQAGGARQLQTITDNALETSSTLFAQAHALVVLARDFPPSVEAALSPSGANTLLALRQRRIGAIAFGLRELETTLRPLLPADPNSPPSSFSAASWQSAAEDLFEASRNLDRLVSRLLAGTYSDQMGQDMLTQLPATLSRVESLVHAQSVAGNQ